MGGDQGALAVAVKEKEDVRHYDVREISCVRVGQAQNLIKDTFGGLLLRNHGLRVVGRGLKGGEAA